VGVLGFPLGTWGWNSNSGGSSAVVSSLFILKGSEGTGGRWKDEPARGWRDWVLRTGVGEGGGGSLCLENKGPCVSLARMEGELLGSGGWGVEVAWGETGRLTSRLSSSSGEDSPSPLLRVVRIVPSVGFLLM